MSGPFQRVTAAIALVLQVIFLLPIQAHAAEVDAPQEPPAVAEESTPTPESSTGTEASGFSTTSDVNVDTGEPIVVTATKTARGTFRLPGEVNIVEREDIEKTQARSLDDVLRYEPGVEMTGSTRRLMQTPNIRGFDDERVLVLRDGARISQFTSGHKGSLFLEADDIKRIEVVRGPVSALYGSGALGGVISLKTLDPSDMLEPGRNIGGQIRSNYSTAYSEYMLAPRVFGRGRGGLEWMLGTTFRQSDGGIELGNTDNELLYNEENINGATARLIYPATDNDLFRFNYDWLKNEGWTLTNLTGTAASTTSLVDRRTEEQTYTAGYEHAGQHWWDENIKLTGYRTILDLVERRLVGSNLDAVNYITTGLDLSNTATVGDRHKVTYGVEYFVDQEKASRNAGFLSFFPSGHQNYTGIYLQDEISLMDNRLSIIPGVRWDQWRSRPGNPALTNQQENDLNPKVGVSYEFLPGWVAAATYGEGFRAPHFQELFVTGTHFPGATFVPNPTLKPEKSSSWDAGLRYQRGDFSARGTYYRSEVEDFIDLRATGANWQNINVQDAVIQGYEAALDWRFLPNWKLEGAYSHSSGLDQNSGVPLSSIQAGKGIAGLEYSREDWGLTLGGRARIYDRWKHAPTGTFIRPGYTLYDAYVAWKPMMTALDDLELNFSVDNITDKGYQSNQFSSMQGVGVDYRFGATWHLGGSAR